MSSEVLTPRGADLEFLRNHKQWRAGLGSLVKVCIDYELSHCEEAWRFGLIIGTWSWTNNFQRQFHYLKDTNDEDDVGYVVLVSGQERHMYANFGDQFVGTLKKVC